MKIKKVTAVLVAILYLSCSDDDSETMVETSTTSVYEVSGSSDIESVGGEGIFRVGNIEIEYQSYVEVQGGKIFYQKAKEGNKEYFF